MTGTVGSEPGRPGTPCSAAVRGGEGREEEERGME